MRDYPQVATVPAPVLPRSHVLSYITNASSPTRVRQVTARALLAFAGIDAFLGMLCLGHIVWDYFQRSGGDWYFDVRMFRWVLLGFDFPSTLSLFFLTAGSVMLVACAGPVSRAREAPCVLAFIIILASMVIFAVGACASGVIGIDRGLGWHKLYFEPLQMLWLAVAFLSIFLVLILRDVAGYLVWILRHPTVEKPPVAFIPKISGHGGNKNGSRS